MTRLLKCASLLAAISIAAQADPVRVRHPRGYLHGYLIVRDTSDKIIASGEIIQSPAGGRIRSVVSLHFADGSLYQETALFSQKGTYRLLSYKQVEKGPSFKTPKVVSFSTAAGKVSVEYGTRHGYEKDLAEQVALPADLVNGLLPTLITDVDPKVETTLSMVVTTPKPRVVKLKIAASGEDIFTVGGVRHTATHYVAKMDLGGATEVVAKVVGKQPPPIDIWVAAGDMPIFLRSRGQLYEDGPLWQIELAAPVWAKSGQ